MKKYKIDIIVPVYNEELHIAKFYDTLNDNLTCSFRVIFVDDGSSDGSWSVIQEISNSNSKALGLRFYKNFGKEAAIRAGLEKSTAKAVVVIDADMQHPVEIVNEMVELWSKGETLVVEAVSYTHLTLPTICSV